MHSHSAPEVVPHQGLQATFEPTLEVVPHDRTQGTCGLKKKSYWIAAITIAAIILTAAVSSLVAITITWKKDDSSKDHVPSSSIASTSMAFSASTGFSTSTASPSLSSPPSQTSPALEAITSGTQVIYRDCPSSNGTNITTGTSPPQTFRKYCSFLFDYNAVSNDNAFESNASSLDGCINLCAAWNAFNGTGPDGPCYNVAWRTDPGQDFWGVCWGKFGPVVGGSLTGRNTTTTMDVPVDAALLIEGL